MKTFVKLVIVTIVLLLTEYSRAAIIIHKNPSVANKYPGAVLEMNLNRFSQLTIKEMGQLMGRKLTLKERISLYVMKTEIKKYQELHPGQTVQDFLLAAPMKHKTLWLILLGVAVIGLIVTLLIINAMNNISITW